MLKSIKIIDIVGNLLLVFWFGLCTMQPIATGMQSLTAAILPLEITDDKGVAMRLVPAGEFTMGSNSDSTAGPAHRVYLDTFYMDTYEVKNARYAECVTAGACDPPHATKSDFRPSYYGNPEYGNFLVIYVD